jgi:demethylspheroidene O-methyltransferase
LLAAAGQCPRCYGGSFLDDPLPRGHDCVTLVRVLFDHEDAVVLRLLRNVRAAMEPGQTLVIAEPMAGNRSRGQRYATAYFGVYVMAMGSGRCRTPEEIGALARQAGFSRFDIQPVPLAVDGNHGCRVSLTFVRQYVKLS